MADRCRFLLGAREVITGFGRIGEHFAETKYGAVPDRVYEVNLSTAPGTSLNS